MVAEIGDAQNPAQNGAETPPSDADGQQIARRVDSAHNQEFALTAPAPVVTRKKGRADVRHTAEYLASRGRLPAESLHHITKRTLAEAVEHIRKAVPGATHVWAADYYLRCVAELMPYVHVKQADIDQPADPVGALGLTAGHFLAASALGMRTTLAAARGHGAAESHNRRLFDSEKPLAHGHQNGSDTMPDTNGGLLIDLPPRGRD